MNKSHASVAVSSYSSYRWIVLLICFLTNFFIISFLHFAIAALAPEIAEDLDISITQALTLFSMIPFVLIFVNVPGGLLGDRFPLRLVGGVAGLIAALSTVGRVWLPTYGGQLVVSLLVGLGIGLIFPNMIKVLTQWFPPSQLGLAQGLNLVGFNLGAALAESISGGIVLRLAGSWERVFLWYGIMALVVVGLWWILVRAPGSSEGVDAGGGHGSTVDLDESAWELIRNLFTLTNTYLLSGISLVSLYMVFGFLGILPTWAERFEFHVPEIYIGTPLYAGAVGAFFLPWISDWLGRRPILYITLLGTIIGDMTCGYSPNFTVFVGSMVVAGICGAGFFAILLTLPGQLPNVGAARAGTLTGVIFALGQIGGAGGPILVSYVLEASGIGLSGLVLTLPALLALPLLQQLKL